MSALKSSSAVDDASLLDVHAVGALFSCSPRTVSRLSDAGRIPRPVRLGALARWSRRELEEWIARGCPAITDGHGEESIRRGA